MAVMEEKFDQVGPRERQIIELLLQGCDNAEIARDLHIAERTVKAEGCSCTVVTKHQRGDPATSESPSPSLRCRRSRHPSVYG